MGGVPAKMGGVPAKMVCNGQTIISPWGAVCRRHFSTYPEIPANMGLVLPPAEMTTPICYHG